ncbi:MAG: hypothetical protein XD51_0248 [Moorella sp. 60_41]|nr:MAG: hypothetical protein XD51_0248 [Moorella sp. 60_41]
MLRSSPDGRRILISLGDPCEERSTTSPGSDSLILFQHQPSSRARETLLLRRPALSRPFLASQAPRRYSCYAAPLPRSARDEAFWLVICLYASTNLRSLSTTFENSTPFLASTSPYHRRPSDRAAGKGEGAGEGRRKGPAGLRGPHSSRPG